MENNIKDSNPNKLTQEQPNNVSNFMDYGQVPTLIFIKPRQKTEIMKHVHTKLQLLLALETYTYQRITTKSDFI